MLAKSASIPTHLVGYGDHRPRSGLLRISTGNATRGGTIEKCPTSNVIARRGALNLSTTAWREGGIGGRGGRGGGASTESILSLQISLLQCHRRSGGNSTVLVARANSGTSGGGHKQDKLRSIAHESQHGSRGTPTNSVPKMPSQITSQGVRSGKRFAAHGERRS